MRTVEFRNLGPAPVVGLGTWRMGRDPAARKREVAAVRKALDLGLTLIDTAEAYAGGGAEEVVGEAIAGRRDGVRIVTKVSPRNATADGVVQHAEGSLRRLGIDVLDLYLLHWPGPHPVAESLQGFRRLRDAGKIRSYGVSNFDVGAMEETFGLPGGDAVAADQILYNLARRSSERRLLPWCREHRVAVMAYSPLDQGSLPVSSGIRRVAERHGVSPQCVAIAWTVREPGVVAIPMSANPAHLEENARAATLTLSPEDLRDLDPDFPPPDRDRPLETA